MTAPTAGLPTIAHARTRRIRDAYVALADDFRDWTPSATFRETFDRTVLSEIRTRLRTTDSLHVLEVGCGDATWAVEIFRAIPEADRRVAYTGFDVTETRIEHGRSRLAGHPRAELLIADGDTFTPPKPVDFVIAVEVFCHLTDRQATRWIGRWHDWLTPGGAFIVIDKDRWTRHAWRLRWDRFKQRCLPRSLRGRPYYFPEHFTGLAAHMCYPSFRHLRRAARSAGFAPRPLVHHGLFRALLADRSRGA